MTPTRSLPWQPHTWTSGDEEAWSGNQQTQSPPSWHWHWVQYTGHNADTSMTPMLQYSVWSILLSTIHYWQLTPRSVVIATVWTHLPDGKVGKPYYHHIKSWYLINLFNVHYDLLGMLSQPKMNKMYLDIYRVSSKTVPTWLFALLSASTHAKVGTFLKNSGNLLQDRHKNFENWFRDSWDNWGQSWQPSFRNWHFAITQRQKNNFYAKGGNFDLNYLSYF